jgi:hypothetical protein
MLCRAIITSLIFLGALSAHANERHPSSQKTSDCITQELQNLFFPEIARHPKSKELERLRSKLIADYFPISEEAVVDGSGHKITRAKYDEKDVKSFESDWDRLLDLRHAFKQVDADLVREGLTLKYNRPYPLITPFIVENLFKENKGKSFTLADLQDKFLTEYMDYKYFQHGEFSGFRKHLSPASPYSATYKASRGGKLLWDKTKLFWVTGLAISLATPLYKPISDVYTAAIDQLKSKALDQLPERKQLAEAIQQKSKLLKETEKLNFTKMQGKPERLRQWLIIENQLKANQMLIDQRRAKIKTPPGVSNQAEPFAPGQLQATRLSLQATLLQLAQNHSTKAETTKVQALANLKALDLLDARPDRDSDPGQREIDQSIDQLADHPVQFQAFIKEYLRAQR